MRMGGREKRGEEEGEEGKGLGRWGDGKSKKSKETEGEKWSIGRREKMRKKRKKEKWRRKEEEGRETRRRRRGGDKIY